MCSFKSNILIIADFAVIRISNDIINSRMFHSALLQIKLQQIPMLPFLICAVCVMVMFFYGLAACYYPLALAFVMSILLRVEFTFFRDDFKRLF